MREEEAQAEASASKRQPKHNKKIALKTPDQVMLAETPATNSKPALKFK